MTTTPANIPAWDDAPWPALPALDADLAADVCVVGLGGSGLACVGELLALGCRVVGIDAGAVASGAAGRNGGFLLAGTAAFHHDAVRRLGHARALALYQLTLAELDRIAAETPDAVRRTGSLRIADSPAELEDCRRQLAAMAADGLPVEPHAGAEGEGLLFPCDAAFQPLRRCRTLAGRAIAHGARLFERSPALTITGDAVRTPGGTVRCGSVVVAVDGRLERIFPDELQGRVRTARLQMLATAPTTEIAVPRPVYARWGYEYWQQLAGGRLLLGGFRDRAGNAEWTDEATPTDVVQCELERFLRERLHVQAPVTHRWAASVGYTADGLPVVAEVRPGVRVAGGYSGTGNVIGAICGRGLARLAAGERWEAAGLFGMV